MTDLDELETLLHTALSVGDMEQATKVGAELDAYPPPAIVSALSAALWYAQQGLHVFPLSPRSKVPHKGTQGCKDATTDEATIRAWWDRWPDSNLGIATGFVVDVIDVDPPCGPKSRAENWEELAALTYYGTVTTPRPGGTHLYVPASGQGNRANIYPNVDYRGAGGYVVAPPSVTDNGSYRWLRPLELP